jgi:phospholipid transport system substrate-binding protein
MTPTPGLVRLLLIFCVTLAGISAAAEPAPPIATVEKLHETLLEMMQQGTTLGYKGRVERIEPVLDETFNFETIGRIVTGRHWKTLDSGKREVFLSTFRQLSAATYADNFSSFGGEAFKTLGDEIKKEACLVRTQIVKTDGSTVSLNYVLNKTGEQWRIVNVVAEGVSDLALKRSEYGAVITSEGIDALIAKLEAKIASYAANNK